MCELRGVKLDTSKIYDAMHAAGIVPPDRMPPLTPGELVRFSVNGKPGDKAGWLRPFDDGKGATFGDWRTGASGFVFFEDDSRKLSAAEVEARRRKVEESRRQAEQVRKTEQAAVSAHARQEWAAATPASLGHGYLTRKKLTATHGTRTDKEGRLLVPVFDNAGQIMSLQRIEPVKPPEGNDKRFYSGAPTKAGRYWLRPAEQATEAAPLILAEGYATAGSVAEALPDCAVVCCFSAGNIESVARDIRAAYPNRVIILAGDDDPRIKDNPGRTKAEAAAKLIAARAVFPTFGEGEAGSDFNDLAALHGLDAVRLALGQAPAAPPRFNLATMTAARLFVGQPPPVQWLVEGVFPRGVVALLASPPGIGKSFLSFELALQVASDKPDHWLDATPYAFGGRMMAHGRAVYVSAEDDHGELHRRLDALNPDKPHPERLHVVSLPDLEGGHFGIVEQVPGVKTLHPSAAWQDLVSEINALDDVRLIVVDTLQALTPADLNDNANAQAVMNELVQLARKTGATVLALHHFAKGAAAKITTALDAAEAIRGAGALVGSCRAAYVLWPPSAEDAKEICKRLEVQHEEGRVIRGMVAKANGQADRTQRTYIRSTGGLLRDKTDLVKAAFGESNAIERGALLDAIAKAANEGDPLALSANSKGSAHGRRLEFAECLHEKPRIWFEKETSWLKTEGKVKSIKRPQGGNGHVLVPDAWQAETEAAA